MLLNVFNLIAILATLAISAYTVFYIIRFTIDILRDARKNSVDTTLTFLFANVSLLTMIAILIKQMVKGL